MKTKNLKIISSKTSKNKYNSNKLTFKLNLNKYQKIAKILKNKTNNHLDFFKNLNKKNLNLLLKKFCILKTCKNKNL